MDINYESLEECTSLDINNAVTREDKIISSYSFVNIDMGPEIIKGEGSILFIEKDFVSSVFTISPEYLQDVFEFGSYEVEFIECNLSDCKVVIENVTRRLSISSSHCDTLTVIIKESGSLASIVLDTTQIKKLIILDSSDANNSGTDLILKNSNTLGNFEYKNLSSKNRTLCVQAQLNSLTHFSSLLARNCIITQYFLTSDNDSAEIFIGSIDLEDVSFTGFLNLKFSKIKLNGNNLKMFNKYSKTNHITTIIRYASELASVLDVRVKENFNGLTISNKLNSILGEQKTDSVIVSKLDTTITSGDEAFRELRRDMHRKDVSPRIINMYSEFFSRPDIDMFNLLTGDIISEANSIVSSRILSEYYGNSTDPSDAIINIRLSVRGTIELTPNIIPKLQQKESTVDNIGLRRGEDRIFGSLGLGRSTSRGRSGEIYASPWREMELELIRRNEVASRPLLGEIDTILVDPISMLQANRIPPSRPTTTDADLSEPELSPNGFDPGFLDNNSIALNVTTEVPSYSILRNLSPAIRSVTVPSGTDINIFDTED